MTAILDNIKSASRKQWLVVVLMTINTIITYVSNVALPKSNSQVSKEYTILLTPPGWAFSIWGLIFTAEWIFTVWQLAYEPKWVSYGLNFYGMILWVIAQSLWALMFPFELIWPCFVCIFAAWFGLLLVEIQGMRNVHKIFDESTKSSDGSSASYSPENCEGFPHHIKYFCLAVAPQAIHLGWITAATSINFVIGVAADNDQLAPQLAASICACCLLAVVAWTRCVAAGDIAVAFALIWALVAIEHRNVADPIRLGNNSSAMVPPASISDALTKTAQVLASLIGSLTIGGYFARAFSRKFVETSNSSTSSSTTEQEGEGRSSTPNQTIIKLI